MKTRHESSEGEEIIEYFLEDQAIKFEREVEINNLLNDSKSYRKADFYLPKYKIYIEFLGNWNDPERRLEYLEKMKVYNSNFIPCVYIYPDNLGVLEMIFLMRIREQFEKYPTLSRQSLLFTLGKFKKMFWMIFYLCFGLFFSLVLIENTFNGNLTIGYQAIIVPATLLIVSILYAIKLLIFKKKKLY